MRIHLYLAAYLQYLTRGFGNEIETASLSTSYECVSPGDPTCCPEQCILNHNLDRKDVTACLDSIGPQCEIQMTAKSTYEQSPCYVEIEPDPNWTQVKRYSSWYRFPSGLKALKLPWNKGRITGIEDKNRCRGCRVILAGLADTPLDDCQPLPESNLFEVPWINSTLGELDGLVGIAGQRQALNVIYEEWNAGESNGLPTARGINPDTATRDLLYHHWEMRCDPLGHQMFNIEVQGSAYGRKGLRTPEYQQLPD